MIETIHLHQLENWYVIYTHELPPPMASGVMYVGCCLYQDLLGFPDAKRNSEWRKLTNNPNGRQIVLKTVSLVEHWEAAKALQQATATITNAYCNKVGLSIEGRQSPIKCVNDGEIYQTIAEAARSYRIPASSISNHLAGRPGYGHVKGNRFERI